MNCPQCGAPEQARVRVCKTCGTAYTSQDLLELRQLEFLLAETAKWPEALARRQSYVERLAALKARLLPAPTPALTVSAAEAASPPATVAEPPPVTAAPPPPRPEPVPFDQWLLSERNIKIALYSGGLLLVLAGLIFVGVNWARIPGPAKFAITLMVTGLLYLGGYLLFQRPALKLGGVALLGVASGFVPLNFVVLQIYIFSAQGLDANVMWFIASIPTLLLYLLTASWTRADLFTYLSMAAVVSLTTAAMVLLDVPLLGFGLAYALLALACLLVARALQSTRLSSFTRAPLLIVAQVAMPILFVANASGWVSVTGCAGCAAGSPWLALTALLVGVAFYVAADLAFHWLLARWAAAAAFAITFVFVLIELEFSGAATGMALMALALAYLLVGYALESRSGTRASAWPLYAAGYAVAAFVTLQALLTFGGDPDDLAKVLIGDVVLLALSAWVHRQYAWIYGATWVFMVPVFIYASLYLRGLSNQGLALGVLMLNYAAAGYALGRRALRLGGPFLTAAAFLSLVVPALTWANAVVVSVVLGLVAALYLLGALWRGWSWLLLPALVAVNVAVITVLRIFLDSTSPWLQALSVAYTALGVVLTLGGARLRQVGQARWGWPLYLVAALNPAGSYLVALYLGGWLAIGLSVVAALLAFGLGWVEREAIARAKLPPLLAYLGAAFVFIGHFYVIGLSARLEQVWPAYTAGLCALFVASSWLLRWGALADLRELAGTPLRRAGSVFMLIPLIGAIVLFEPLLGAVTYAIAGVVYAADAAIRRVLYLGYLAGGAFVVVIWALLLFFGVNELQAYAMPLGLGLVALGWNERRRSQRATYWWPTVFGLLVLMGSAFFQSLDSVIYAVLLLAESLIALAWGVRTHSRGYVQLGLLSLVANGIAQLGPGFAELPRWIQLGLVGVILLGGGMAALFRREQILTTRRAIVTEWKRWEP